VTLGVCDHRGAVLMRASQPRVGLTGARSAADEALLRYALVLVLVVCNVLYAVSCVMPLVDA
jgi:hypothetical protein